MKHIIEFLEIENIEKSTIFGQIKCNKEEALVLRQILRRYISGDEDVLSSEVLIELFGDKEYIFLTKLPIIKNLIEMGWIVQNTLMPHRAEGAVLELLNASISLTPAFLKLIEEGNLELILPEAKAYTDHLEYLQDQFLRIELYQKMTNVKHNSKLDSPNMARIKSKLMLLENRIEDRIKETTTPLSVEEIAQEKGLSEKEKIIFLALLKEEYSGTDENLREMNHLIDLVSFDELERIKNRALLEESSKLVESGIVDYDEILTPFGGISRSFFISEEILQTIMHPQKKKKKQKIRLDMLIKEQEIFELIEPKTSLDDVVLNPQTRQNLETLMGQMDKNVVTLLKEWGVKDKKGGMEARIIFYGPAGTGKTMTALSLARSLKKPVLSFDCSKILSMYVGESEKNVRKIFDTYKELKDKTKSEPVLLLNEADQFLSTRTTSSAGSAEKMHNQMQNIFLEQIERFDGILIATTNLLETIDAAFSRRFNYKIKFDKPNASQRQILWDKLLPKNAPYEQNFESQILAQYALTGGQIQVIVKNTAYKIATQKEPYFRMEDFIDEIKNELKGNFDSEKSMGFVTS